jgi:pyridinium-3,5-bisthiocarboxylic acid mononucleotide nickel chelatase
VGKTLYIDCFSGAAGDMFLGAFLDLGLPFEALREALGSLAIDHGTIAAERVLRAGVSATKFTLLEPEATRGPAPLPGSGSGGMEQPMSVSISSPASHSHAAEPHRPGHRHDHPHEHGHDAHESGGHGHHRLADIEHYIDRSALSASGRARAIALFRRLAEAEAAIHQMPVERVHLHEVGALDSIVDIVGSVFAMEWLGADHVVASPVNVGSGTVRCAHGIFPVPAPATAALLKGAPIYSRGVPTELTTPTGALLVTEFAGSYGPLPEMRVSEIGYGAGTKDFPEHPNVLRLLVGESVQGSALETIVSIECEIDDMNPQLFGPLMDRLYGAGALDVYYAAVQMKKNRPGTLVTVIAAPDRREALAGILFSDTTTIGVRHREMLRERLERTIRTIETPVGPIRFKVASRNGLIVNASPEFEDCVKAASERGLPIKEVQARAIKAWIDREG